MASETSEDTRPPPTFQGRLKLESFMFNGGAPATGVRRSPRLHTPSPAALAPPSPSPTPSSANKRKKALAASSPDQVAATNNSDGGGDVSALSASSSSSPSATPSSPGRKGKKRARQSSSYAPPSTYAHLPLLPDALAPNLLILFVGLNPGIETARTQHAYAHPTNLFWRLLHSSGITPRLCSPTEDRRMPALYALGLTNIVARPTRNGAELSRAEMDAGVAVLERKVRAWRPEAVCVVGKSIWESLWRVRHGRPIRPAEFRYGWQDEAENMGLAAAAAAAPPPGVRPGLDDKEEEEERVEGVEYSPDWKGARVFVATSTSGLAATLKPKEKEEVWRVLGEWTVKRRAERAAAATTV